MSSLQFNVGPKGPLWLPSGYPLESVSTCSIFVVQNHWYKICTTSLKSTTLDKPNFHVVGKGNMRHNAYVEDVIYLSMYTSLVLDVNRGYIELRDFSYILSALWLMDFCLG
jgi:hypothetical protein